jgi:hypothetical protein
MIDNLPDLFAVPTYFDVEPEPNDPYHQELARLVDNLARIKIHVVGKRQMAINAYFQNKSGKDIAELAGYQKPPPIREWFKQPNSPELEMYGLLQKIYNLRAGPTIEQRKHLLWKIALNEHENSPSNAIRSIDTVNKMEGVYSNDEETQTHVHNETNINLTNVNWTELNKVLANARSQEKEIIGVRVNDE